MTCEKCSTVLPPNRCELCRTCGKDVHIDRGMLLWAGQCSDCYFKTLDTREE